MTMRVYLDHNATSPLRPEASAAMALANRHAWGNPSSPHAEGRRARGTIDDARQTLCDVLGCHEAELIFTASATEANHLAIHGVLPLLLQEVAEGGQATLVVSAVEHPSVIQAARQLYAAGRIQLVVLDVDGSGVVRPAALAAVLSTVPAGTALVSIIAGNNETGVIQPVVQLGEVARAAGALFHVDATQCLGRIPVGVGEAGWNVDLLTCSSHKVGGPRGAGVLYARRGLKVHPVLGGGHQERDRRGGTEDTASIAGFAAAVKAAVGQLAVDSVRIGALRDQLEAGIRESIEEVTVIAADAERLPNTLAVAFAGCVGEDLLVSLDLDGIAASSGSACSSGSLEPSPVLVAMGLSMELARSVVRFSLGWSTTEEHISLVLRALPAIVARCRQLEFD